MTLAARTTAMRQYFDTQWADKTPVDWPDAPFTPPDGESWVRFNCQHNDGYQASIGTVGSNKFRRVGLVTIQIFQPVGKASIEAQALADIAIAIFQGQAVGDIHFYNVRPKEIGPDGNGYYQINVLAEFRYDDIA
jgi:hypothetical protein